MARLFLDTSALVKLYVREPGTDRVLGLAAAADAELLLLALTRVELRAAIRRRERMGDIVSEDADRAIGQFEADWQRQFLIQAATDGVLSIAVALVDRHGLRALDALQLGACLTLFQAGGADPPLFVCSDQQLNQAAAAEGLRFLDPAATD